MLSQVDPVWRERLAGMAQMSPEESELWYWRYSAETIHQAGHNVSNYCFVNYDQLASEPLSTLRRVYAFLGLPWTSWIESEVARRSQRSSAIATDWKRRLDAKDEQLIERVLSGSTRPALWEQTGH
jgi:hypothetical protein